MAKKKAFLGAAIGAVAGIAQGLIADHQQKKAEQAAAIQRNKAATFEEAQRITQGLANDINFDDKVQYGRLGMKVARKRCGGSIKKAKLGTSVKYSDRDFKFRCGGKRSTK